MLSSALASIIPGLDVQGFDEYMNLVLDEAEEVSLKRKSRKPLGQLPCYMYMPCRDSLLLCQNAKTLVTICAQKRRAYTTERRQHHAHADHVSDADVASIAAHEPCFAAVCFYHHVLDNMASVVCRGRPAT